MEVAQAKRILSKMENETRARLGSGATVSEPECEVHASNDQKELQEHLNNISSLRDLFVKQSQTLALMEQDDDEFQHEAEVSTVASSSTILSKDSLSRDHSVCSMSSQITGCKSFEQTLDEVTETLKSCGANFREISPTSVTAVGSFNPASLQGCERLLDFEESEDILSTHLCLDGTDSEIQAAINEIRREASQMDIVMALDQLKTMETELEVTTRALRERSAEAEDLKKRLEHKNERVSCLELERDLFKADASKLRDDLKTCVDRMFDISAVAGTSSLPDMLQEQREEVARNNIVSDQAILRPASAPPDYAILPIEFSAPLDNTRSDGRGNEARPSERRSPAIRRKSSVSDPTNSSKLGSKQTALEQVFPFLGANHSSSIFRTNVQTPSPTKPQPGCFSSSNSPHRRHRSFSEVIRSSSKPVARPAWNGDDEEDSKAQRICGLFRRRQSKRFSTRAKDVADMREQIDQLHTMMRASLETSEKLRKRLAMISRYYEGIIRKLQEQMVEVKTEKARVKAEADSRVSAIDHDKRIAISDLENELRQKDAEIDSLKEKLRSPRCEI